MAQTDHFGITDQTKASAHRLQDAWALCHEKRWRGAMYLAGYAVECLLKARLMRMFGCRTLSKLETELQRRGSLPRDWTVFTHQLLPLLRLTQAVPRLQQDGANWRMFMTVNQWKPAWRYSPPITRQDEAEGFLHAVEAVVRWIEVNV